MKDKIEEILDKLLKRTQKGEDIESLLKEYPQLADELRPLLKLAVEIEDIPKPELDADAISILVAKVRQTMRSRKPSVGFSLKNLFTLHPIISRAVTAIVLVFVLALTTVFMSANSLPGNPLYQIKRISEKIHYAITFNDDGKAELHLIFANRRTHEFESSFKIGEKIDRKLLMKMLEETASAVDISQNLSADHAPLIRQKIAQCNKKQLAVLENTKQYACPCDIDIIQTAIKKCRELHACLGCEQTPCNEPYCPCNE